MDGIIENKAAYQTVCLALKIHRCVFEPVARRSMYLTCPSLCFCQNAKTQLFQKPSPYGLASHRALSNSLRWMVDPRVVGCAAPGNVPGHGQARCPAVAFFTLLGQPFLQILLREMRRVRGMWCCGMKANTTHGTMRCRSLLLPQYIWPRGPMDKASAYGAGDGRFESCRGHFCLNMQQHGLTSIIRQSSCGMMFASVRHAELENEYTLKKVQQPALEPGPHRWERAILPRIHWCSVFRASRAHDPGKRQA